MNKSILFVTSYFQQMSGASKILRSIAQSSIDWFDSVAVVCILCEDFEFDIRGVELISLKEKAKNKGVWRISAINKLRKLFKERRPDIICSFVSDTSAMSRIASLGLKSTIISCERVDPYTFPRLWQIITRWTYSNSDYNIFQLVQARDFYSMKVKEKSVVIPNQFVPLATPICEDEERNLTVVSAGRLCEYQKRFLTLIKAFAIVHSHYPKYTLIIYGDGPSKSLYNKTIKEYGLQDCVFLPGFVKNVSEEIKKDGIFVLPSAFEGIPNVLLEAMSMGLPCVATDCSPGGARFLLENGLLGEIVDVDDLVNMASKIEYYITKPNVALYKGNMAKKSIERFMPEIIINKWRSFFESVCSDIDKNK